MSKKLKQNKKQQKFIHGWPIDKVKCFNRFNHCIFYIESRNKFQIYFKGFSIGVDAKRWDSYGLDNSSILWTSKSETYQDEEAGNFLTTASLPNSFLTIANLPLETPTNEQIKSITHWREQKEYIKHLNNFGRDPWSWRGIP